MGWGSPSQRGCGGGKGRERGPGSRAGCALPGSLPHPPSAPGCLGCKGWATAMNLLQQPAGVGGLGDGEGRRRGPWKPADGIAECRGVYPGTGWGFSVPHPPGERGPPGGASCYHAASHRQQGLLPGRDWSKGMGSLGLRRQVDGGGGGGGYRAVFLCSDSYTGKMSPCTPQIQSPLTTPYPNTPTSSAL